MSSAETAATPPAAAPRLRGRLLLEVAVLAVLLANTVAYLFCSDTYVEGHEWLVHAKVTREHWQADQVADWFEVNRYYPPLHPIYMALFPGPLHPVPAGPLVVWGLLPMLAGMLWMARRLDRHEPGPGLTGPLFLVGLGGFPLVNAYLKIAHYETGMMAAQCGVLALLAGPAGLPSRAGCAGLGAVVAAGMLCKWTLPLYCGPAIALAAVLACRRGLAWREAAGRLALIGLVVAAVAGPWYWVCLDWDRLAATTGNDLTFPDARGWETYRLGLRLHQDFWRYSVGEAMWPVVLAGVLLGLLRRTGLTLTFLSSAILPTLALPGMGHLEVRYLLAALPGLAAATALGLGSLRRPWWTAGLAALSALALFQLADRTWSGYGEVKLDSLVGARQSYSYELEMLWQSDRPARLAWQRAECWSRFLAPDDRREATLACHPLDPSAGLHAGRFSFIAHREASPREVRFAGYESIHYVSFLEALSAGTMTFLALSEQALLVDLAQSRQTAAEAWHFVPQVGEMLHSPGGAPPEEPFALEVIRQRFGVLEQLPEAAGKLFLLVRRDAWERGSGGRSLAQLPGVSRRRHGNPGVP